VLTHPSFNPMTKHLTPRVPIGALVRKIVIGYNHTCALLEDGAVRCWGRGREGQLGYGNREDVGDNETPEAVGNVKLGAKAITPMIT
jgi:alpha-tubulin suppressor-like RCC1 family protein